MVNGTPRVADVYGDGSAPSSWHAILTFQTGSGDPARSMGPAVYALTYQPGRSTIVWGDAVQSRLSEPASA
jgi:hypothetical protein